MTLGQVVSNVVSAGLVAGWVSLRAYELYQAYTNTEQNAEDGEAQGQEQAAQAAARRQMQGGPVVFTYTSGLGGSRVVYGLPGADTNELEDALLGGGSGRADNPLGVDLLNLQLGLINRDFTEADYEMLLALDRDSTGRGTPVSEKQLAALPAHAWQPSPKQQEAPSGNSSSSSTSGLRRSLQQRFSRSHNSSKSSGSSPETKLAAPVEAEAPSCSICLEDFQQGAQVSALPCLHQFHASCVQPWLRQQGSASTCPICKTPVFS